MPKRIPRRSAGVLLYRRAGRRLEVLLAHPGGPFWKNKDDGAWSIPKGEYGENEDPLAAAKREFAEETGLSLPGDFIPLGEVRQPGGKVVTAWAVEREFDVAQLRSNTFSMPWPPGSGKSQEFPEIDRVAWFSVDDARRRILKGQTELLDRLVQHLRLRGDTLYIEEGFP